MEDVVITGAKPGFEFEAARNVKQLNKQYSRTKKQLTRERFERQRVLRRVR